MIKRSLSYATAGLAACMAFAAPAAAQEVTDGWQASVTGYLWLSGYSGEAAAQPDGHPIESEAEFGDLLDNLSGLFLGKAELRYNRVGLYGDVLYLGLEGERTVQPGELPGIGRTVETGTTTATISAFYRAIENENLNVDILAGVRLNDLNFELDIQGPGPGVARELKRSWTTPILGVRATQRIGERTSITGYGDFGSNDDSEVWQLYGTFNWAWTKKATLSAGYRYYRLEFDQPRIRYDVTLSGPLVALTYNF